MINVFDPDTLIIGGGAIETEEAFQAWFIDEVRKGMPSQREEQLSITIKIMPNGDTAGARVLQSRLSGRSYLKTDLYTFETTAD